MGQTISSFMLWMTLRSILCEARLVIVDDEYGDEMTSSRPHYTEESNPNGGWHQGNGCESCIATGIDTTSGQVQNSTWHDATGGRNSNLSIEYNFTGELISENSPQLGAKKSVIGYGVAAYFILAGRNLYNPTRLVIADTALTFFIDGELVDSFTHNSTLAENYLYNVSVYSNSTLENKNHTFQIRAKDGVDSLMLFDYVTYK